MEPWWMPALREVVDGRRVVLAGAVPVVWGEHVETLRRCGATDFLVVATEGAGAGEAPDVACVVVEQPPDLTMMERLRAGLRALADPPQEVIAAIDDFDPDHTAVIIGTFLADTPTLAGRPLLAHRLPEWLRLEDKTLADELWDRAGVARKPSAIAAVGEARSASAPIDEGHGTVWSGDARDGFHGGATLVRWVVDGATAAAAAATLDPSCDLVRVMPFVDGIACSVHGIVLPDGVVVARPVEMVTLRRGHELFYGGCATYWDPPQATRRQMRDGARRVGQLLADEVGFRGVFTVDGVVDGDGFWPTELNPRFGAGMNVIARAVPDLPILLLNDLIVAGVPIGRSAVELESELVALADTHRGGGTWHVVGAHGAPVADRSIRYDGKRWSWAADGDPAHASVLCANGFARASFAAEHTPVGPSVGERAAAFWAFADRELGTGIGELTAAPDRGKG